MTYELKFFKENATAIINPAEAQNYPFDTNTFIAVLVFALTVVGCVGLFFSYREDIQRCLYNRAHNSEPPRPNI